MTEDDVYANAIEEQAASVLETQLGGMVLFEVIVTFSWAGIGARVWLHRTESDRLVAYRCKPDNEPGPFLHSWKKSAWYVEGMDPPERRLYPDVWPLLGLRRVKDGE